MTDRRDPPEPLIPELDGDSNAASPRRSRRAHDARPTAAEPLRTRLRHPRLVPITIALAVLALGILAAQRLGSGFAAWLHARPEYHVSFDAIVVDPPPPLFLKGGREALLHQIRSTSGLDAELPALDVRPDDLARRIALASPWIEAVDQVAVDGHPPTLRLSLRYRRPVAVLLGPKSTPIILDRQGVVLPADEILPDLSGPLMSLQGWTAALEPRPGLGLATPGSDTERRLQSAMRLAEFVIEKTPRDQSTPTLKTVNIRYGESLLYTQTDQGLWVLWGEAPGQETPGQPTADQKWNQLTDWLDRNPFDPQRMGGGYLVFSASGARLEGGATGRRDDSGSRGSTRSGEFAGSVSR